MENQIKKAIILMAGLGTRFLPLSKVVPKELWPLGEKPIIHYIVEETKASGIKEIIFVISPEKKIVLDYFKKSPKLEKFLKDKRRDQLVKEIKNFTELWQGISFSFVLQKKPLGDGHAILQTKNKIGKEPVAILFSDDVVDSQIPCLLQLLQVFKTAQKPVIALSRVPKEKLPFYGVVSAEKIASRLYKIKEIVEKPPLGKAPSELAIVGKYIVTPEIFDYLRKARPSLTGEIRLAEALDRMIKDGKIIYGYEFEGKWLECGDKGRWLESNLYLSLKHPEFGEKLKKLFL